MENEITAHKDGKVTVLAVKEGAALNSGDLLATIEYADALEAVGLRRWPLWTRSGAPNCSPDEGPARPARGCPRWR